MSDSDHFLQFFCSINLLVTFKKETPIENNKILSEKSLDISESDMPLCNGKVISNNVYSSFKEFNHHAV